jgi:hypothetical protein
MDEHEGPGHGDVTLSFTRQQGDGSWLYQSWTVCECSPLVQRLSQVLGPAEHESVATDEAYRATGEAVLSVPGVVHQGEGFS